MYALHESGITPLKKFNDFSCFFVCSICTLAVATRLVAVDAWAEKLFLHIIGGAIRRGSCDVR